DLDEARRSLQALVSQGQADATHDPVVSTLNQLDRYRLWWGDQDFGGHLPQTTLEQANTLHRELTALRTAPSTTPA
ncbi:MAG: hypothetical protein KDK91_28115, partial [Gammaproteobacteria bacterium]|nr:hypothetical protein [Gammaproteobacteria bacterium]